MNTQRNLTSMVHEVSGRWRCEDSCEPRKYRAAAQLYSNELESAPRLETACKMGTVGHTLISSSSSVEKACKLIEARNLSATSMLIKYRESMAGETPR